MLEILSTSVGSGFFRILERKTETDPSESVFGTNDPSPTADLIGSAGFRVGSGRNLRVGRIFGLDGQPYLRPIVIVAAVVTFKLILFCLQFMNWNV